ncbi:hypothetical protein ACHHYP_00031 [Achlya hypogyna]|uniref:Transmembrane protein n=1 Tax=Achlya hypogyna TaxID=1202772 RepID=A0A1V9ZD86_ACHHY|nr:hypothetical protein ACHHYP_00031 [Achlya hypogyna]
MRSLLSNSTSHDDEYAGYSEDKSVLGRGLLSDSLTPTSYYQSKRHLKLLAVGVFVLCVGIVPYVAWPSRVELTAGGSNLRHHSSASQDLLLDVASEAPAAITDAPASTNLRVHEAPPTVAHTTHIAESTTAPVPEETTGAPVESTVAVAASPVAAPTTEATNHAPTSETTTTEPTIQKPILEPSIAEPTTAAVALPYPAECADDVAALHAGEHLVLEHASDACRAAYKQLLLTETATEAEALEDKLAAMEAEMHRLREKLAEDEAALSLAPEREP